MRILAPLLMLVGTGLLLVSTATGADAPDRPPGIEADHWVSLGKSIGVALSSEDDESQPRNPSPQKPSRPMVGNPKDRTVLLAPTSPATRAAVEHAESQEPLHGHLMVKQDGIWRRLLLAASE